MLATAPRRVECCDCREETCLRVECDGYQYHSSRDAGFTQAGVSSKAAARVAITSGAEGGATA